MMAALPPLSIEQMTERDRTRPVESSKDATLASMREALEKIERKAETLRANAEADGRSI